MKLRDMFFIEYREGSFPIFRYCKISRQQLKVNKVYMQEMYEFKLRLIRGCGATSINHWTNLFIHRLGVSWRARELVQRYAKT